MHRGDKWQRQGEGDRETQTGKLPGTETASAQAQLEKTWRGEEGGQGRGEEPEEKTVLGET